MLFSANFVSTSNDDNSETSSDTSELSIYRSKNHDDYVNDSVCSSHQTDHISLSSEKTSSPFPNKINLNSNLITLNFPQKPPTLHALFHSPKLPIQCQDNNSDSSSSPPFFSGNDVISRKSFELFLASLTSKSNTETEGIEITPKKQVNLNVNYDNNKKDSSTTMPILTSTHSPILPEIPLPVIPLTSDNILSNVKSSRAIEQERYKELEKIYLEWIQREPNRPFIAADHWSIACQRVSLKETTDSDDIMSPERLYHVFHVQRPHVMKEIKNEIFWQNLHIKVLETFEEIMATDYVGNLILNFVTDHAKTFTETRQLRLDGTHMHETYNTFQNFVEFVNSNILSVLTKSHPQIIIDNFIEWIYHEDFVSIDLKHSDTYEATDDKDFLDLTSTKRQLVVSHRLYEILNAISHYNSFCSWVDSVIDGKSEFNVTEGSLNLIQRETVQL